MDPAVTEGDPRAEAERQRLDGEAEARRKELETEERVRRQRKLVRSLNLKAEAATTVRRKFLCSLLAAKTPPKTAAAYVATTLAGDGHLLTEFRADGVLKEVLSIKDSYSSQYVADQVVKAGASRAQVLTLALVLAAQESRHRQGLVAIEAPGHRGVPGIPRGAGAFADADRGNHGREATARSGLRPRSRRIVAVYLTRLMQSNGIDSSYEGHSTRSAIR